ncbi:MAG: hypothetical protein Q9195_008337 [Heterodermia aff. obscurata]
MPPAYYTDGARPIPRGSFGPITRFIDQYGLPPGRREISLDDFVPGYRTVKEFKNSGILNEGIYGVRKMEGRGAGQRCILKRIAFERGKGRLFLREIEILHVLDHPNIVRFIDGCIPRGPEGVAELYIEYCDRGNLQDLLNKYINYNKEYDYEHHPYEYIPEAFLWEVFRSMASALAYLHFGVDPDDLDNPPAIDKRWPYILHRDIKPDNILLKSTSGGRDSREGSSSGYPTVVLADFGCCTQKHENQYNPREDRDVVAGTFVWQGPEFPEHTTRGDVWTLGLIILSLCNQLKHFAQSPRPENSISPLHNTKILTPPPPQGPVPLKYAEDYRGRDGIRDMKISGEYYSTPLREMIRSCLRVDIKRRPLSNVLLGDIREAEEEVDAPYEPLPDWVFKKR